MKILLSEKLDNFKKTDEENRSILLKEFFEKNEKPTRLFKMNNIGEIKEIQLEGFRVVYMDTTTRYIYPPYTNSVKKVTNSLLIAYSEYLELTKRLNHIIFVDYKDTGSGSYKFNDIIESKFLSFNHDDLKEESIHRNEVYGNKDGYTPCGYCRKQTPNESLIERIIIGRGRKDVYNSWKGRYENKACITESNMKFCSNECAGYEQMSREG